MNIDKILIIASAVIKNDMGKILLLKRGETKTFQNHWQLPEGKLEENESPLDALKREINVQQKYDLIIGMRSNLSIVKIKIQTASQQADEELGD